MKKSWFYRFVFLLALLIAPAVFAQEEVQLPRDDECISCHVEDENLPEDFSKFDIHLQAGLSCVGCHGGDAGSDDDEVAMSPAAGYVGVPSKQQIPQFCGKCHSDIEVMRKYQPRISTDQVSQYYTSVHGQKLAGGDAKVADCTSCHTAHAILPAKDTRSSVHALQVPATCNQCHGDATYMAEYGIRTSQYEDFAGSVHGKALLEKQDTGAPACNDCHGNHGAIPVGVASISHVCGTCHVNNMQLFANSKMADAFAGDDIHACEECHGNHAIDPAFDDMVGVGEKSVCMDCHEDGDDGFKSARSIRAHLDTLVSAYDSADANRAEVNRIGMDDVEIGFLLQESHQSLIQARTLVHSFDAEKVGEMTGAGVKKANEALELAKREVNDYRIRRIGFGAATFFISMLAIALFFKIRDMEDSSRK